MDGEPEDDASEDATVVSPVSPLGPRETKARPSGERSAVSPGLPLPGEEVAGYRIVRLLGKGGMGAVFHAKHLATGADCALKVLLATGKDAEKFVERFQREVEAVAKVDRHAGIVRIHATGKLGARNLPYAVMDLVAGGDLAARLENGPLSPDESAALLEKVARSLHHCHEKGVIHRDLKPANILMREDGEPLLSDFGLARDDLKERLTKTGEILGTPAYMAPEQAAGEASGQDRRTDVYGLGAILYECLTGKPPFSGTAGVALLKKVLVDDPRSPSEENAAVPVDASAIVLRCLAKERDDRYPTALALADDLARFRRGDTVLARPLGKWAKRWRRLKRRKREIAMVLVSVLVVAGAATAAAVSRQIDRGEQAASKLAELRRGLESAESALAAAGFPAVRPERAALDAADRALDAVRSSIRSLATLGYATGEVEARQADDLERWLLLLREPARAGEGSPPSPSRRRLLLDALARTGLAWDGKGSIGEARSLGRSLQDDDGKLVLALAQVVERKEGALAGLAALGDGLGVASVATESAAWCPILERAWRTTLEDVFSGKKPRDLRALAPQLEVLLGRGGGSASLPRLREALRGVTGEDADAFASLVDDDSGRSDERLARSEAVARVALALDAAPLSNAALARRSALAARLELSARKELQRSLADPRLFHTAFPTVMKRARLMRQLGCAPSAGLTAALYDHIAAKGIASGVRLGIEDILHILGFQLALGRAPLDGETLFALTRGGQGEKWCTLEELRPHLSRFLECYEREDLAAPLVAGIALCEAVARSAGRIRPADAVPPALFAALDEAQRQLDGYAKRTARPDESEEVLGALRGVARYWTVALRVARRTLLRVQRTPRQSVEDARADAQIYVEARDLGYPNEWQVEVALVLLLGQCAQTIIDAGQPRNAVEPAEQAIDHARRLDEIRRKLAAESRDLAARGSLDDESRVRAFELTFVHGSSGQAYLRSTVEVDSAPTMLAYAHSLRAFCHPDRAEARRSADEAEKNLLAVIAANDQAHAHFQLARILDWEGRLGEALEHAEHCAASATSRDDPLELQEVELARKLALDLRRRLAASRGPK